MGTLIRKLKESLYIYNIKDSILREYSIIHV